MNDTWLYLNEMDRIVNKVFKTADEMFAIRFWRENPLE